MKLFGTDGIRGVAGGEKMNPEVVAAFGRSIVSFCRKRNLPEKIIVGRDTRESGLMFEEALVAGISSAGNFADPGSGLPHQRAKGGGGDRDFSLAQSLSGQRPKAFQK